MSLHADILDYTWKSILAFSIVSSVIMSVALGTYHLVRTRTSNAKLKLFFNLHSGLLLLSLGLMSIVLIFADPELASACFSQFASQSDSLNITRTLAGTYLFIVGTMASMDVVRSLLAFLKVRSLRKADSPLAQNILAELKATLNLRPSTELYVSSEVESPFAWGVFRHRIVVNKGLLDPAHQEKLKAILSHEAIHVKDHDSFWMLLSHITKRLLFFNPLSYLFQAKHHLVTEMTADELAIRQCGAKKSHLLRALIEIAEQCTKGKGTVLQAHASKGFRELSARIQAMTHEKQQRAQGLFPAVVTLSLVSCSFVALNQARASLEASGGAGRQSELMCSQVKHEKVIEVWLNMQSSPSPNKCEIE